MAAILLAPLGVLAYLKAVPENDFPLRLVPLHQFVTAVIVIPTAILGTLALRSFLLTGGSRDLGLGAAFLAYAAVHLWRVAFVTQDPNVFLLYGPGSRIALAYGLLLLAAHERHIAAPERLRHALTALAITALLGVGSWVAFSPLQAVGLSPEATNQVRLALEAIAIALVAAAVGRLVWRNGAEPHLVVALALAGEQSLLFLLSEPWRLLWWTAHIVGLVAVQGLAWAVLLEAERSRLLGAERAARITAEIALRARDQFFSVAAHELRTPVAAVQAYSQLLQRETARLGPAEQGPLQESVSAIVDHSRKITTLVGQLLDIERLHHRPGPVVRPIWTDVAEVVRSAGRAVQLRTDRSVNLDAPSLLEARIDPLWVEQALANLLDNAVRYSPAAAPIEVQLQETVSGVEISVGDRGDGVPAAARDQLFQPFYRVQPERGEGRGLGLYICRLVAEAHHGQIVAEFPDDGGSRFLLRLPRGEPPGT